MSSPSKSNLAVYSGIVVALIALIGNFVNSYEQTQIEKLRHDSELIVSAIRDDIGQTRKMLEFFLDSGLIDDPGNLRSQISSPDTMPNSTGAIACYAGKEFGGLYEISGTENVVMGFVEGLHGHYQNRIFQPQGFEGEDISNLLYFKNLCAEEIESCIDSNGISQCWAGGDTGGLYGFN